MNILKEESYPSLIIPEKRFELENFYYYETMPHNSQLSTIHLESNEKSTYESSDSQKNYFDCLTFMDFSNSEDRQLLSESPQIKIAKSMFSSELQSTSKKLFYTYKKEKTIKKPAMICDQDNCGMAFRHKWIFQRHLSSHLTFKFFKCMVIGCNKMYKSKENLNLHTKNIHEGIKPYPCRYCSLKFSHRNGKYLIN